MRYRLIVFALICGMLTSPLWATGSTPDSTQGDIVTQHAMPFDSELDHGPLIDPGG